MHETMTASEARAYLAESEENRVKDRDKNQWKMKEGVTLYKYPDGDWGLPLMSKYHPRTMTFDDYAPFTPYVRRTKRQLREECERYKSLYEGVIEAANKQHDRAEELSTALVAEILRAEEAEHNLKNLLARIFRDGGHKADSYATLSEATEQADLEAAEYIIGYGDVLRRAEAAEARVKELEAQLNALALERDDLAHSLGYAEATIATMTAERDALRTKFPGNYIPLEEGGTQ